MTKPGRCPVVSSGAHSAAETRMALHYRLGDRRASKQRKPPPRPGLAWRQKPPRRTGISLVFTSKNQPSRRVGLYIFVGLVCVVPFDP